MSFSANTDRHDGTDTDNNATEIQPHPGTVGSMQVPDALIKNPDQSVDTTTNAVQNAKELAKTQNPWWIHRMTDADTDADAVFDHNESDRRLAHALLKAAEDALTSSSGVGWGDISDSGNDTLLFTETALTLVRAVVSERAILKAKWARENAPSDATTENDLLRKYEPFVTPRTLTALPAPSDTQTDTADNTDTSKNDVESSPDKEATDSDADKESENEDDGTFTVALKDSESQADCMIRVVKTLVRDYGLLESVSLPYSAPRCEYPVLVQDGQQEGIGGNQTWRTVSGIDRDGVLVDTKFRKRDKKRRLESLAAECGLEATFENWD